jgi:lysophospholipase L1-like esterase
MLRGSSVGEPGASETDRHPLFGKTGGALVVMALALGAAEVGRNVLAAARGGAPSDSAGPTRATQPSPSAEAPAVGEQPLPSSENRPTINNALPTGAAGSAWPEVDPSVQGTLKSLPIEDPTGHALDAFFRRLRLTERGEGTAVTRVLYYGDSVIASDYVSGTVRRRLQARFGDAGHGFILIANPWEWYFHNDVEHWSDGDWRASRLAGPIANDAMYGLGGVSFASYGGSAATFGTATHGDFGRQVSRFDVYYLEQPGGGDVEITVRGRPAERLPTRGPAKASRVHAVHVEDGENRLRLRAVGGGPVRLFGVALERDEPGVVYDALGSHAAMAVYWQRQDKSHWRDELELRDPALVILQYGTNESESLRLDRDQYERSLADLVEELRGISGDAPILVIAPLDRGEVRGGRIVTKAVIQDLVAIQERVALAHGAAFWNAFAAMGGEGSMARWVRTRPQLAGGDLTHPTPTGAEVMGDMLSDAIVAAYDEWRERTGANL